MALDRPGNYSRQRSLTATGLQLLAADGYHTERKRTEYAGLAFMPRQRLTACRTAPLLHSR